LGPRLVARAGPAPPGGGLAPQTELIAHRDDGAKVPQRPEPGDSRPSSLGAGGPGGRRSERAWTTASAPPSTAPRMAPSRAASTVRASLCPGGICPDVTTAAARPPSTPKSRARAKLIPTTHLPSALPAQQPVGLRPPGRARPAVADSPARKPVGPGARGV